MSGASEAWVVIQIAESVRAAEGLLLQVLALLDIDVRAAMPEEAGWVLTGDDAENLRTLLGEHGEIGERLNALTEGLPDDGVAATYADVRDGAAAALANGILDPNVVTVTAAALDVRVGWSALAEALVSTDVRSAWEDLGCHELLVAFRHADRRRVDRALDHAEVEPDRRWSDLSPDAALRLARALREFASYR